MGQPPRFAVFGHPVAHSRSPMIHAAFARQTGIALHYEAIDVVSAGALPDRLAAFMADGGRGANVTLPFKQTVLPLCASLGASARAAGAVNTLRLGTAGWHGENTDGIGLVRDLTQRHGLVLTACRLLLLGAGGAARGVLPALLDAGVAEMIVSNRTHARALALQDAWRDEPRVRIQPWSDLAAVHEPDLVIDATSAGRATDGMTLLPAALVHAGAVAVSLNYGAAGAPFLQWAAAHGARACIDGLGMLVEQAAESFRVWHGVLPQTEPVHAMLRGT